LSEFFNAPTYDDNTTNVSASDTFDDNSTDTFQKFANTSSNDENCGIVSISKADWWFLKSGGGPLTCWKEESLTGIWSAAWPSGATG
jgi:hypothetical protein